MTVKQFLFFVLFIQSLLLICIQGKDNNSNSAKFQDIKAQKTSKISKKQDHEHTKYTACFLILTRYYKDEFDSLANILNIYDNDSETTIIYDKIFYINLNYCLGKMTNEQSQYIIKSISNNIAKSISNDTDIKVEIGNYVFEFENIHEGVSSTYKNMDMDLKQVVEEKYRKEFDLIKNFVFEKNQKLMVMNKDMQKNMCQAIFWTTFAFFLSFLAYGLKRILKKTFKKKKCHKKGECGKSKKDKSDKATEEVEKKEKVADSNGKIDKANSDKSEDEDSENGEGISKTQEPNNIARENIKNLAENGFNGPLDENDNSEWKTIVNPKKAKNAKQKTPKLKSNINKITKKNEENLNQTQEQVYEWKPKDPKVETPKSELDEWLVVKTKSK